MAKWRKSGRGSWKKSTFLYIAQNWLITYFLIFCIKVEGIKGYKLAQTPFFRKILILMGESAQNVPKWPKNRVFGLLSKIESLVFARNVLK